MTGGSLAGQTVGPREIETPLRFRTRESIGICLEIAKNCFDIDGVPCLQTGKFYGERFLTSNSQDQTIKC